MRRVFKKSLIIIISCMLGIVTLFGFAGCNTGTDELQSKIDALKISVDKQVYKSDEEILVGITLENLSGADIDIAYYSPLAVPDSPSGQFPAIEQSPEMIKRIFENGESIRITDRLGGCFSVGQHRLKYRAVFYLGWETTDSVIEVWSNTIDISIIE